MSPGRRSIGRVVLATVALALLASSCTSVRNGLGTSDGVCFSALPVARKLVGATPSFAGVRYLSAATLEVDIEKIRRKHQHVTLPPLLRAAGHKGTCLVGYRGKLPSGVTADAWRPLKGPYHFAIVVIRLSTHRVLGVLLLGRPPVRFAHL